MNQRIFDPDHYNMIKSADVRPAIEELNTLSKQTSTRPDVFYAKLLERVCDVVGAVGGIVWTSTRQTTGVVATCPGSSLQVKASLSREGVPFLRTMQGDVHFCEEITSNQILTRLLLFGENAGDEGSEPKQTDAEQELFGIDQQQANGLNVEPVGEQKLCSGVHLLATGIDSVVVLQLLTLNESFQESTLATGFLDAAREIAEDFHRNSELSRLRRSSLVDRKMIELSGRLLQIEDDNHLMHEVVNSALGLFQVERAGLLTQTDQRLVLAAISGVSHVNSHADSVQEIVQKASNASSRGMPYFHTKNLEPGETSYSIIPLVTATEVDNTTWLLYLEGLAEDVNEQEVLRGSSQVGQLVSSTRKLENRTLTSRLRSTRTSLHLGYWAIGLVACLLLLWLIPGTLMIRADGTIRPKVERGVYAPLDGEIVKVNVQHDQVVKKGETLMFMESVDLDFRYSELLGEQLATLEKIRAIEAKEASTDGGDENANEVARVIDAANLKELRILQESQLAQLKMLNRQKEGLKIKSPIDGRVVSWQPGKKLEDRQVRRGELLLSVAKLEGEWTAEIEVRGRHTGHLIEGFRQEENLPANCMLVAGPGITFEGSVKEMANHTQLNTEGAPVVITRGEFDFSSASSIRNGSRLRVTIDCGRRSLGYVYFNELIDAFRRWWF